MTPVNEGLRSLEAGQGRPLVHLQSPCPPRLTAAHERLARQFRVVALEAPAHPGDPAALARAIGALGIDAFDLMGTSATAAAALELALHEPARVRSLVLEAPAALGGTEREARLERRLPDLAAPTLVLWGTADEAMPAAVRRVYAELIPGAHLVFVYAAARAIGADRPEAFAGVVADFLERREAFVISRAPTLIHP